VVHVIMVRGIGIGVPPLGIDSCIIFQTNHLPGIEFARS
jgi:hypothetical protein